MTGSGRYPASVFGECASGVVGVARRLRRSLFCSESPLEVAASKAGTDGIQPCLWSRPTAAPGERASTRHQYIGGAKLQANSQQQVELTEVANSTKCE